MHTGLNSSAHSNTGLRDIQKLDSEVLGNNVGTNKGNNLLSILLESVTGNLTANKLRYLTLYFVIISVLELLAYYFKGVFSVLASRVWVITGFVCLLTIMVYYIKSAVQDLKESKYFAFLSMIALASGLVFILGNLSIAEINPDGAQQAAAGMDSFKYSDFNYTGTAFLSYPNRQYIITALPALLFGRSIFTLQLGFALPFILGIFLLYSAFRKWAQKLGLDTNLAVLPLYAFFVFPYITEYYANFEQAIYPVCFTMLAIGFFLPLLCEPNVINVICLAWICCLFGDSYTPALATLGLFLVFMALCSYLWLVKPSAMPFKVSAPALAAEAFLLVEGNAIIFLLATFLERRQDKLSEIRSGIKFCKAVVDSIYDFLADKNAVFFGVSGVIVIVYLIAGLTLRLKWRDLLISLWILGVIAASDLLTGYTAYEPYWIMQRAMIIIPVIITAVTITLFDLLHKKNIQISKGIITVFLITFTFVGFNNFNKPNQSFIYFNYVQQMKYMLGDLERTVKAEELKPTSEFNLIMYTDNILIKNLSDYTMFLFPNARVYIPENGEYPQDIDLSLDTFAYGENGLPGNIAAAAVKQVVPYENKKHDVTGYWYKGILRHTASSE